MERYGWDGQFAGAVGGVTPVNIPRGVLRVWFETDSLASNTTLL